MSYQGRFLNTEVIWTIESIAALKNKSGDTVKDSQNR